LSERTGIAGWRANSTAKIEQRFCSNAIGDKRVNGTAAVATSQEMCAAASGVRSARKKKKAASR
jgi:hypothetical protein